MWKLHRSCQQVQADQKYAGKRIHFSLVKGNKASKEVKCKREEAKNLEFVLISNFQILLRILKY